MNCEHVIEIDDGEQVCTCCGTIVGICIDESAEWRSYENSETTNSRTGTITNELLPNASYGSVMMRKRFGVQSEEAKTIAKLSAWSFSSHGERSWMGIFDAIQASCNRASLPKAIIMDACGMFKQVEDSQKTRGETRRAMMAASVFVACRQHNATRTHEEVASMFFVSIRALCKALMKFQSEVSSVLNTQLGIAERVCVDMNIGDSDRDRIILMLQNLPEMEHTPKTIVAGVVSHVLGGQIPKVSEATGVSVVSIRKMAEKLKNRDMESK
jgi:transcription initiation factor TFIIIB Brf1 subunit/transcription initiation factor TFIIB